MKKLFFVALRELRCLRRDYAGLLTLFFMPMVLVVLITLVQQNVMEMTGQIKTEVAWLELDSDVPGSLLRKRLENANLHIRQQPEWTEEELRQAVRRGKFQAGVIVRSDAGSLPRLRVYFDPGLMAGLRSSVRAQLEMAVQSVLFEQELERIRRKLERFTRTAGVPAEMIPAEVSLPEAIRIMDEKGGSQAGEYSPVQQNVIAWALFGVFFTAVPLAGSVLRERSSGIRVRLQSLPVAPLQLAGGRGAAYLGICMVQFLLIAMTGYFIFPLLGLPAFTVSASPFPVAAAALCSALAACGFGTLLGEACTGFEQASSVGATAVVAASALGGIMVPVHAMPDIMRSISRLSPLNWGLNAFQELLMRGGSLREAAPDLGLLLLFAGAMVLMAAGTKSRVPPGNA
jgi:ABC-2 type transport system permease protein